LVATTEEKCHMNAPNCKKKDFNSRTL